MRKNNGFSLVELIVVIAIMAVMIGILAPTLMGNIEKSRESADITVLDTVFEAVRSAYADINGGPAAKSDAQIKTGKTIEDILNGTDPFSTLVTEYLDGMNPTKEISSDSALENSSKLYVKIDEDKIMVWIGKADGTANKTVKLLDPNGDVKDYKIGFTFTNTTTPESGERTDEE